MKLVKYVFLFLGMANYSLVAQTAEQIGLALATASYQSELGFESSTSQATMVLKNKSGQESTREFFIKTKERANDGDQSILGFKTPKDMRGTAILTYTNNEGADDQWVFLPAVGRVKRIASENKSGPFMGSELAYEDLTSTVIDKYTYRYLRTEGQLEVIERVPTDKKSGYSKQIVWYNSLNGNREEKIEFYDRKNTLLKTSIKSDFKLYLDKYWKAHTLVMTNHQTGKSTTLNTTEFNFKVGLNENEFTQDALKRTRN